MSVDSVTKKRQRNDSDEDSYEPESDVSSGDEYAPPPKKRARVSRKKKKATTPINEEEKLETDDDDDDIGSNENNNIENWQNEKKKLNQKINTLLTENKKLKNEIFKLKLSKKSNSNTMSSKETTKLIKKYMKKWGKALPAKSKRKNTKFYGMETEIIVEDTTLTKNEFDIIFKNKGRKIQPLPNYKPKSVITILEFDDWNTINAMFKENGADLSKKVQISIWRPSRMFRPSYYIGTGNGNINSLTVQYNRSNKKLQLKWYIERDMNGDDWFW